MRLARRNRDGIREGRGIERGAAPGFERPLPDSSGGVAAPPRPAAERGAVVAPARERRRGWRTRNAAAAAADTAAAGVLALARLVMLVAVLIALLIGLAIVLRDVDANARNSIVKGVHEGANFFAGGFSGLVTFAGHAKREITVDWGIALLVYLIAGAIVASAIARLARRRPRAPAY